MIMVFLKLPGQAFNFVCEPWCKITVREKPGFRFGQFWAQLGAKRHVWARLGTFRHLLDRFGMF
jgi:hypothetical protein